MASQKASLGSGDLRPNASRTASRQERRRTSQTLGLPSPQVLKADRKVPDGRPRSMRLAGRPLVVRSVSGRSPASVRATLVAAGPRLLLGPQDAADRHCGLRRPASGSSAPARRLRDSETTCTGRLSTSRGHATRAVWTRHQLWSWTLCLTPDFVRAPLPYPCTYM